MSNQIQNPNKDKKYDLKERTSKFGKEVIWFLKTLTYNPINTPLISQLVRSATSIGANYMEADVAESKKDFQHKIAISKKEAKETLHWLQMIEAANNNVEGQCKRFSQETRELVLIFSAILRK
ncbi:four helix bundle protein [Candidatus Gottesmanbacteria bacterium CG_4_10_14_0_8_um_filter_37_24]|uniref:Four helix bundle protein n=3 Tax=Microgenomates group TaxID=1794810 RepID=A0A2M7RR22_9BACT|nr:MAG: four helix bundle protein [Candidatus Roizmanbacteria bacterium CG03_land_8_20_14_0_80_36_21]PIV37402.1 MAG: four helix bundle protein [Candidatus Roizmanbacteria bacterium CG02_land_8_20_14_3_00_36_15]PIZ02732.1 MAG: four helix bundle protein [Candidatus Gottesmanbacteria bacterium CG_4_10_14_0_8_um_filter_37_24]PJA53580.1 MAG: four helix bundle protein [Candidatus Roizmanbacteria bacterium CG_4_9_14_3_um_filter_36_11]PJC81397.1 MAG: four helix bundle protein [Candidatus Roizmanbacteri